MLAFAYAELAVHWYAKAEEPNASPHSCRGSRVVTAAMRHKTTSTGEQALLN